MKRVLLLTFLCFIAMIHQVNGEETQINAEQIPVFYLTKHAVFVYDENGEVLGTIHKGQPYIYTEKTDKCYYIEVENYVGCVPASATIEKTEKLHEEKLDRSGKMVYTTRYTQLKDVNGNILYTSHPNRRHYVFEKDDTH